MTGRWFQVRVKSPGWRQWRTDRYLANPYNRPNGQTVEEVRAAYARLYPEPGTQIEVEITEAVEGGPGDGVVQPQG